MSEPTAPLQQDLPHHEPPAPAEKVTGASESNTAGLSTLPEKRPSRRFFGLFKGER